VVNITLYYFCEARQSRFRPYSYFGEDEASIVIDDVEVTVFDLPGATE